MITLLTGAPGSGKTAQLVEWLRTLYTDRPLFVHGLDGLTLDHQVIDASKWHTEVPDGAIVVIDEVQQVWRPRGPGAQPPPSVMALETHRHRDIDFFLTTQKPSLLDANVRGLVGRHVHLRDTGWLGRWLYEWPECSENVAWKTCAIKRRFKLPKKAFSHYKSSVGHTGVQKTRSLMPFITLGLVALAFVLAFMVYRAVAGNVEVKPPSPAASAAPGDFSPGRPGQAVTRDALAHAFTPRIPDRAETAPAYDELRKVANMPRVVGGYCVGARCRCFDNQSRDLRWSDAKCLAWLKDPPYDPYFVPTVPTAPRPAFSASEPRVASS